MGMRMLMGFNAQNGAENSAENGAQNGVTKWCKSCKSCKSATSSTHGEVTPLPIPPPQAPLPRDSLENPLSVTRPWYQ